MSAKAADVVAEDEPTATPATWIRDPTFGRRRELLEVTTEDLREVIDTWSMRDARTCAKSHW